LVRETARAFTESEIVARGRENDRKGPEGREKPNSTETSIAKLYASEAAVNCANTAIQVHGGAGYVDDHPVERYFATPA
jgi:alkylation response protein AidB-like acyl-CoA dehydrogenase